MAMYSTYVKLAFSNSGFCTEKVGLFIVFRVNVTCVLNKNKF